MINNLISDLNLNKLWSAIPTKKEENIFAICNMTFKDWKELSQILNVFNDEKYETARYLLLQKNKETNTIIEHISVTSKIPTFSSVTTSFEMLEKLRLYIQKNDMQLLFVHNHPSGNVLPSEEDIKFTSFLEQQFIDNNNISRFAGHMIIGNETNTSFFNIENKNWEILYKNKIISPESYIPQIKKSFFPTIMGNTGILQLAEVSDMIQQKININIDNKIFGFYINKNKQIAGIQLFDSEDFYTIQSQNLPHTIKSSARETGSDSIIFIMPKTDHNLFGQIEYFAQQTQMLDNVYHPTEFNYETLKKYIAGGKIFNTQNENKIYVMDSRILKENLISNSNEINTKKTKTILSKEIYYEKCV